MSSTARPVSSHTDPEGSPGEKKLRGQGMRQSVTDQSPVGTYKRLIVGSDSWWDLIRYETLGSLGASLPGAVGLAFRKVFWPGLFHRVGSGTVWGRGIGVRQPHKMSFGEGVVVDDYVYLDAKGCSTGEFHFGDGAMVSRHAALSAKEGGIRVGDRGTIGTGCVLHSFGGIEIGEDTMVAALCHIGGGRYDYQGDPTVPMHEQPLPGRGVTIEEDCWIGAGANVLDGVTVGAGGVVAAGAVVVDDVRPGSIVGGVPAKEIGERFPESRERDDFG